MSTDQNREYIRTRVNPIYENMLLDILITKPDDVIQFMQRWLIEKGPQFQNHAADVQPHQTLDQLKAKYKSKNEDHPSSESDESDDEVEALPIEVLKQQKVKDRQSVSAEAFGRFNKKGDFKPRVVPKSQEAKQGIQKRLLQAFMFSALDDKERNIVIDAMEEKKFKPGDYVIRQGEDGDVLYILDSGQADCFKKFKANEPDKYLKTYQPGESFGELALLYNCPRAASIVAKTNCLMWALDRQTFNHIVKDAAARKRDKYEDFLSKVEILKSIDPYERSQIADALKTVKAKKGEYVIKQGEQGDIFFMVEEGELEAIKQDRPGEKGTVVKQYKVNDYFGELALLRNQPRAASVVCKSDCTLVALDRYTFKRLLGPIDEILKRNATMYDKYNKM